MTKTIIVIEGPDYTGKGTLVRNIAEFFKQSNLPFDQTREPGGTPFSEDIRDVLKGNTCKGTSNRTKLAGMFCARFDLCEHVAQSDKHIWLFDRHSLSTAAYQLFYSGTATEKDFELFEAMQAQVDDILSEFNVKYILLDVNTEVCAERKKAAQADRNEADLNDVIEQTYSNHLQLRQAYDEAFKYFQTTGRMSLYKRIDTSFLTPEQVFNQAQTFLLE